MKTWKYWLRWALPTLHVLLKYLMNETASVCVVPHHHSLLLSGENPTAGCRTVVKTIGAPAVWVIAKQTNADTHYNSSLLVISEFVCLPPTVRTNLLKARREEKRERETSHFHFRVERKRDRCVSSEPETYLGFVAQSAIRTALLNYLNVWFQVTSSN